MVRALVFLATLVGGLALDLWSKALAFRHVPAPDSRAVEVIRGFFYIAHAENDGAMWSLFQGLPREFWIALRGGVFLLILVYYSRSRGFPRWVDVAFGLVLAGALGNLHDNTFGSGRVRDFLLFVFWGWPFPTFNVADSMICCGAVLLLLWFLVLDSKPKEVSAP